MIKRPIDYWQTNELPVIGIVKANETGDFEAWQASELPMIASATYSAAGVSKSGNAGMMTGLAISI